MSLYSSEMARAIRTVKKPHEFTMDVAEDTYQLNLLFYESEFDRLSNIQALDCLHYLWEVAVVLEGFGAKVNIQGVPGEPREL